MYKVTIEKGYPVLTFVFSVFEQATIFVQTALINCSDEIEVNISRIKEGEM